ncbi:MULTISPECIES: hypothetical protein [unclassified Lentimonas]|uniref:hypothetical protein n=1 Tax=unclassified Lentimonas TaxID=2630993 RepID=UPI001322017C|nr:MULTISPECIES: hypothetical protein [unclassified Lentimonas]CAA6679589.1 Unannotated [Lentimonas sp. CC4]CAA6687307.1 Unannotated [Lentimonas sp. CC6]CAA6696786.1 Unannotated [Lentimonas sp. CC19]CAA6697420.1 Unannotated [Lentimonas sp. CC10]CAA7071349.1 Unannotated [Lentimonas sp. CC11]
MLKPKKLLFWILFGIVAFQLFEYVKVQTEGDVIAYKRLAKAIMKNDDYVIKDASAGELAAKILTTQTGREELFHGSDILMTYYNVKSRKVSADQNSVSLVVEQVSRVNPPGFDTLWGEKEVRLKHAVQLVKRDQDWIIKSFDDPAIDMAPTGGGHKSELRLFLDL